MNRICNQPNCQHKARPGGKLCHRHNMQRYRERSPIRYIFITLKHNALRRHKMFHLSLQEFTNFLLNNPLYMQLKGRFNASLQIDRIHNIGGMGIYAIGNIQVISKKRNLEKIAEEIQETEDTYVHYTEDDLPF